MNKIKVDRLDAHDRYQHFTHQSFDIAECCNDLIEKRPFGDHPFYIFVHPRTDDDGVTKRLIWQPRLTRPEAQTNSMLFKGYPGSDRVDVIWMIPAEEMWAQYKRGKLCENNIVAESIHLFRTDRKKLEEKDKADLDDEAIRKIYAEMAAQAKASSSSPADPS